MDIKHVHVGGHHLFDLRAPKICGASPVGAAFEGSPRSAELAAIGAEPLEDADADQAVGAVKCWARSE